ncbi:MAG: hypothetical protein ACLTYN_08720 [Dysosmobacter welbionis]
MAYVMLGKTRPRGGEMIRGKWKWLLILLAALAVLVGLMALETLLGSVRKCG